MFDLEAILKDFKKKVKPDMFPEIRNENGELVNFAACAWCRNGDGKKKPVILRP